MGLAWEGYWSLASTYFSLLDGSPMSGESKRYLDCPSWVKIDQVWL